ncbi:FecR family protein [Pandoraea commovens]|uniref:Fe2+-dicitrate sensor, membrane protein n=1 Tax=Pandoraea commovens TaxID=2508289 RepID=A0A5E4XIP4_9BURK|nr:FecR domain-containing protein [Pandoraea commovens]UVA81031.1 FecR domain-containing protein [Pandoraea commovens]VVE36163.1 Fe2+-dicitrate sensor, membrane protein [Pandoraea commovens]
MTSIPDDHANTPDELHRQAWVWLRLLKSDTVRQWDAERFRHWLDASPAHKAAFNAARAQWDSYTPAAAALGQTLGRRTPPVRVAVRTGRRAFLGTMVAGGAALAVAAIVHPPAGLWPSPDQWGADYSTATGEQRAIRLAGSAGQVDVTLNTQTRIRTDVSASVPGIELLSGEAAVDLPGGRGNGMGTAFVVAAAGGTSSSTSGRFEVRYLDGRVCVTCLSGAVRVDHPMGQRVLHAAQQTAYDRHQLAGVTLADAANVSAWRNGELVFRQTRLAVVLDEINRYRPGRIVLMNDKVRNQPVSGSFYIASLDRAIAQLQYSFDLHARQLPGGLLVLT